jgi:hypothetical protein
MRTWIHCPILQRRRDRERENYRMIGSCMYVKINGGGRKKKPLPMALIELYLEL